MDTSKAAAALGRLGGKAGRGESQRRGDSDHYRAIRAQRRYFVEIRYTSGSRVVAEDAPSLAAAKAAARVAWDAQPGMHAVITSTSGRTWDASETHGSGMLWR